MVQFNKEYKFKQFDSYVYDQHTKAGKKMGRGAEYWVISVVSLHHSNV